MSLLRQVYEEKYGAAKPQPLKDEFVFGEKVAASFFDELGKLNEKTAREIEEARKNAEAKK